MMMMMMMMMMIATTTTTTTVVVFVVVASVNENEIGCGSCFVGCSLESPIVIQIVLFIYLTVFHPNASVPSLLRETDHHDYFSQ
jgi:hypothetical protein